MEKTDPMCALCGVPLPGAHHRRKYCRRCARAARNQRQRVYRSKPQVARRLNEKRRRKYALQKAKSVEPSANGNA